MTSPQVRVVQLGAAAKSTKTTLMMKPTPHSLGECTPWGTFVKENRESERYNVNNGTDQNSPTEVTAARQIAGTHETSEQAMEGVIKANDEVLAIYSEACQILGAIQRIIPQAGLPPLDNSTGQSHWDYLEMWYR